MKIMQCSATKQVYNNLNLLYSDKMKKEIKPRNPIARVVSRVHCAKVVPAKKGKGSFRRIKKVEVDGYQG